MGSLPSSFGGAFSKRLRSAPCLIIDVYKNQKPHNKQHIDLYKIERNNGTLHDCTSTFFP